MYNNREYQKTYINTSASTTVFTGRGNLGGIMLNTTSTGTITLIDGTSPFAVLAASFPVGEYMQGAVISKSLIVSTAGASDITILWTKG